MKKKFPVHSFHCNTIETNTFSFFKRYVEDLQDLLGPFLFIQFLSSTVILGIGIFKFVIVSIYIQKFKGERQSDPKVLQ